MDLEAIVVCLVLFLVSAGVLMFISLFGTKPKSYDEAVAEKRTIADSLTTAPSVKPKKNKKAGKKIKEKFVHESKVVESTIETEPFLEPEPEPEQEQEPDHHHAKGHVEFVKPEAQAVIESSKERRKRKVKVKPILLNKEKSCAPTHDTNLLTPPLNHFEDTKPMDELQILKIRHKHDEPEPIKEKEVKQQKKSKLESESTKENKATVKTKTIVDSTIEEPAVVVIPVQTLTVKSSKKKKNELTVLQQMSGDREGVSVSLLAPLLSNAELSRSELQILIDLLLNKQHGPTSEHSEWSEGRADPVQKLKKQLAEKEKALVDEQEASAAVQAKLRELRTELNTERSRLNASSRNYEEALNAKANEAHVLATKLQQIVESHNAEKHALAQQIQQVQAKLNEEHLVARKLQEEQTATQELLAQRQQFEKHIGQLTETEACLNAQLHQMHAKLNESQNAYLLEIKSLKDELVYRDTQLQDLVNQLEESKHQSHDYDQRLGVAKNTENDLIMEIRRLLGELDVVPSLKAEIARLCSGNSKAVQQHFDIERKLEESDRFVSQLRSQLTSLQAEKETLLSTILELQEKVKQNGVSNNEVSNASKVELLNLQNALDSIRAELKRSETENLDNKSQLSTLTMQNAEYQNQVSTGSSQLAQQEMQIADLKSEIESYKTNLKDLNDSLIEATAKDAEVLSSREDIQKETVERLQRLFPSVKVSVVTSLHEEWLNEFCAQLKDMLVNGLSEDKDNLKLVQRIKELESEMTQLAIATTQYKKIIVDTESTLSALQSHVESEEERWQTLLVDKENELEMIKRHSLAQMQSKLDDFENKLASELQRRFDLQKEFDTSKLEWAHQCNSAKTSETSYTDMGVIEQLKEENSHLQARLSEILANETRQKALLETTIKSYPSDIPDTKNGPNADTSSLHMPDPISNGQSEKKSKTNRKKKSSRQAGKLKRFAVWLPKKLTLKRRMKKDRR